MLNLFRSHNPYSVLALFLLAVCLKFYYLIHPGDIIVLPHQIVWEQIAGVFHVIFGTSAFGYTFFALLNIVGQGIYLNRIAGKFNLFPKNSYLPAMSYVVLSALLPEWNYFSVFVISNWLVLGALNGLLILHVTEDIRKLLFNIGFIISLSTILVFSNVFLILMIFIALAILRTFKIEEWILAIVGIMTPIYLLLGILFLYDALPLALKMIPLDLMKFTLLEGLDPMGLFLPLFFLLFLLLLGLFYLNKFSDKMIMQTKKTWGIILIFLFISLIDGFFNVSDGFYAWLSSLFPLSLIFTNLWFEAKKPWISGIIFYLFIAVIIYLQWF